MPQVIDVINVAKSYRQGGVFTKQRTVDVLKNISLNIGEGESLGLLGASGSGKSTLGRLILGLEKPDSGSILYYGKPLSDLHGTEKENWRKEVQVVFQNSHGAVNPRFTARRIIGEPLKNFFRLSKSQIISRVGELMEKVGLDGAQQDKLPHQFSGGELQRICIARAMSSRPKLVVLDEAVSSLDMGSQGLVLDLLERARDATGASYLFISHDLRVIFKLSDKLAVMHDGEISFQTSDMDSITEQKG
ncbi:MAG: dipeptide/oligopeptide/nickel ABC transporter ATP-binding protein, partial [Deltaproteobacteria bacterium]|nr:dipeptide/oligopeptide/nickel ABC transporter ATP-binding protein [Deltaproteobacteria bacterium]